ncbi:FtsK/SpoIIIE domain-containing protein [Knoellia sp. LjRoot47]|uniref:FtsK/SpoIIIE domain-containing protein n=1 Tax=Knoellia sp. LjRoot47 TaxID=3342330 RepID=UPI003ECFFFED
MATRRRTRTRRATTWTRWAYPAAACVAAYVVGDALHLFDTALGYYALLWAAALAAVQWLTTYDASTAVAPRRERVWAADLLALITAVSTLVLTPATPTVSTLVGVAAGTVGSIALLVGVGRRLVAMHPTPGVTGWLYRAAVAAAADRRRALVGTLAITPVAAALLAYTGMPMAGLITVVMFLVAPVIAPRIPAAVLDGRLTEAVERTLAGVMSGGAWTHLRAEAHRAPISSLTVADGRPETVWLPIPPQSTAAAQETIESEIRARMTEWGTYAAAFTAGGTAARGVLVRRTTPLPQSLRYDGRAAVDGTRVWIGRALAGRAHEHAPGSVGVINGESFDFTWDLRVEPHGIAVGTTGSGKSQTVQLAMAQLALAGWRLVLIDPKQVEFSQWVGRPGVIRVTTELDDHADALVAAADEMKRRYEALTAAGVNHIDSLPDDRPPRLLVVVDEAVELLAPMKGRSDEAKEVNATKERASAAIGSILRLGRAAGVHLILAAQRADRAVLDGEYQNNLAFKILQGGSEHIERTMIGLTDVVATPGVPGRAVARSIRVPQAEVQVAYINLEADLDRYLRVGGAEIAPVVVDLDEADLEVPVVPDVPRQLSEYVRPAGPAPQATTRRDVAHHGDGPDSEDEASPETNNKNSHQRAKKDFAEKRKEPLAPGEAQAALEAMIGLEATKDVLRRIRARVEHEADLAQHGLSDDEVAPGNYVFVGPPGTGKTTFARILGSLLRDAGALRSGHVIETTRADLVDSYIGWTGPNTHDAADAAMDGVLFVDEAYALAGRGGSDFGQEAMEAILVRAENDRDRLCIVLAGYSDEMEELLASNSGLGSRFRHRVPFPAYSPAELEQIYAARVDATRRRLDSDAAAAIPALIAEQDLDSRDWGNARSIRDLVDEALARQSLRMQELRRSGASLTLEDKITLTAQDVLGDVEQPVGSNEPDWLTA